MNDEPDGGWEEYKKSMTNTSKGRESEMKCVNPDCEDNAREYGIFCSEECWKEYDNAK